MYVVLTEETTISVVTVTDTVTVVLEVDGVQRQPENIPGPWQIQVPFNE